MSSKGSEGGARLSFHWDAFDIEGMLGEKMITSSFSEATLASAGPAPSRKDTWRLG